MTQTELLDELKEMTHRMIETAKQFQRVTPSKLNSRIGEGEWSILECFKHMNLYNAIYTEELKKALEAKPDVGEEERRFKSGWIGGRTVNSMLPHEKMRKMKTFDKMNPLGSELEAKEIQRFIKDQRIFFDIMKVAKQKDLNKVRCKLTLPLIKFNGGDTLRFIQNHNARHLAQAKRTLDLK